MAILDVSGQSSWVQAYETTLSAVPKNQGNGFHPIPEHEIPATFDSHTLIIKASSQNAKSNWRLGFYLEMHVNIESIGRCYVGNQVANLGTTLIRLPKLTTHYWLKIIIPEYHRDITIKLWKYVGFESDTIDLGEQIHLRTIEIESKVNFLYNQYYSTG